MKILGILRNHSCERPGEGLLMNLRELILEEMKASGSLEYTAGIMRRMDGELMELLKEIESFTGIENGFMDILLTKLRL
jgi:hypothetical protein